MAVPFYRDVLGLPVGAASPGAIDVARAELRYGRNERLRRIAQEISVTQQHAE